jgi:hypothetical protein
MAWGGHEGQIIGMKQRERRLETTHRELETRVQKILTSLKRHKRDRDSLEPLVNWAEEQLNRVLQGEDVVRFSRRTRSKQQGK